MTLNDIAYSLLNLIRGDYKEGDYVDIREIYNFIHTQRALWLDKMLSKPYPNLESFEQDLGILDVESIDTTGYSGIDTGYNILQTVKDIPKPIYKRGKPLITRVGSVDKSDINFEFMTKRSIKYFGNGVFNSQLIGAYYEYPKIKLRSNNHFTGGIEKINVQGIFPNPQLLSGFTLADGSNCFDPDKEYPIDDALIDYLTGDVIKYKLQMYLDTPSDRNNDGTLTLERNNETKTQ